MTAPRISRRSRRIVVTVAIAVACIATLLYALRGGAVYSESLVGLHLAPGRYLVRMLAGWDPKLFLGVENGGSQFVLPEAFVYAALERVGFDAGVAQRIVFTMQLAAIASSLGFLCGALGKIGRFGPIPGIAIAFYLLNLYVPFTLQNNSIFLWPYCAQPLLLGLIIEGFRRQRPIPYGIALGVASLIVTGVNLTFVAIVMVTSAIVVVSLAAERFSFDEIRRLASLLAIGLVTALVLNAYWVVPYVYHIKNTWIAGYFAESLDWHSAAAIVPDLLRLLGDPLFFGGDARTGPNYPYSASFLPTTFFTVLGFVIVATTFVPFVVRRVRRMLPVRLALVLLVTSIVMVSGGHVGPDGGAWLARPYAYLYSHFLTFQIFRGLNKWQSVSALALAVLFGYFASSLRLACARIGALPRIVREPLALALPLGLVFTAFSPIASAGIFRSDEAIGSIPPYWAQFAHRLASRREGRVAIFPRLFSPVYFWGTTGGDFPSLALDHATTYQLALGSGVPSQDQSVAMDAIDEGVETNASWAPDLFRRLGISDLVEQSDSAYAPADRYATPLDQMLRLQSVAGARVRPHRTGNLVAFPLPNAQAGVVRQRAVVSDVDGFDVFRLAALLDADEAVVTPRTDADLRLGTVVATGESTDALARVLSAPLAAGDITTAPWYFKLARAANARVYYRSLSPLSARAGVVTIDERKFDVPPASDWRLLTGGRLAAGSHAIQGDGTSTWRFSIVDESEYSRHVAATAALARDTFFPKLTEKATVARSERGRYDVFAVVNDFVERSARFPASFARASASTALGSCTETMGSFGPQPVSRDAQYPPAWWYASQAYRPLTDAGLFYPQWIPARGTLQLYNPYRHSAAADVTLRAAPLGAARVLKLQSDPSVALTFPPVDANLVAAAAFPVAKHFATDLGRPSTVIARVRLPQPGWNRVPYAVENDVEVPIADLGGFLDAGVVDDVSARVCSDERAIRPFVAPASAAVVRSEVGRVLLEDAPNGSGFASVPLGVPAVSARAHPILEIRADRALHAGAFVEAIYRRGRTYARTYAPLVATPDEKVYVARLYDGVRASSGSILASVVLDVDMADSAPIEFSNPTVTLDIARTSHRPIEMRTVAGSIDYLAAGLVDGDHVTIPFAALGGADASPAYVLRDERDRAVGVRAPLAQVGEPRDATNGSVTLAFELPAELRSEIEEKPPEKTTIAPQPVMPFAMSLAHSGQTFVQSSRANLPGTFAREGDRIVVDALVADVREIAPWTLTFVPRSWVASSSDSSERVVRVPVSGTPSMATVSYAADRRVALHIDRVPFGAATHDGDVAFRNAYIERLMPTDEAGDPRPFGLRVNGRDVALHEDARRRFVGTIALRGGDTIESQGGRPLSVLVRRASRRVSNAGLVVYNEGYSAGWSATSHGRPLDHLKVNGFANGYVTRDEPEDVAFVFALDAILAWSRRVTLLGFLAVALYAASATFKHPRARR
ncbi:MAG: hypothetical protein NVSMB21_14630 [Vulcanimicrobiaceae bacterium]